MCISTKIDEEMTNRANEQMDRWIYEYMDKGTHTTRNYLKLGFITFESIVSLKGNSK